MSKEREAFNWEPIQKFWRNNSGVNWDELETAIKEALAQPEQEPVAFKCGDAIVHIKPPIYGATPSQRTWVGLTIEDVQEILNDPRFQMKPLIVHAVEAKLKEKNHG